MMRFQRRPPADKLLILLALCLSGCAVPVFDPEGADTALTPAAAARDAAALEGRRVIWGGEIVESRNLARVTELVVLAMPLQRSQRPDPGGEPLGRFIAMYPGYLETVKFAPGRHVTVKGTLTGAETRPVGDADYEYPVMDAAAVHLWPEDDGRDGGVRFGVGIGIIR